MARIVKKLTVYTDFISPYAYLAFHKLPGAIAPFLSSLPVGGKNEGHAAPPAAGLELSVSYRPILFASLLKAHGNIGPAEITAKRAWVYRQVLWQAATSTPSIPMRMPASHPFNPLSVLRLALAAAPSGSAGEVSAEAVGAAFAHVWAAGGDPNDPARLASLRSTLKLQRDPDGDEVKADLRANGDAALAAGAFGVPSFAIDGKTLWGCDALPMLGDYLSACARAKDGVPSADSWWGKGSEWDSAPATPVGIARAAPKPAAPAAKSS